MASSKASSQRRATDHSGWEAGGAQLVVGLGLEAHGLTMTSPPAATAPTTMMSAAATANLTLNPFGAMSHHLQPGAFPVLSA